MVENRLKKNTIMVFNYHTGKVINGKKMTDTKSAIQINCRTKAVKELNPTR